MCEELFTLCDLQLGAIVADLDRSVETVSDAAVRLISFDGSADGAELHGHAGESVREFHADLRQVVMGLQIHDELAQRISHIQTLLKLIQEQTTLVPGLERDPTAMLHMVSGIFSSDAEFRQLGKVFPEYDAADVIDRVELF